MAKDYIIFPLRLSPEMHELIHKAAFAVGKSKHKYCLDAIMKEAQRDAANVHIEPPEKEQDPDT